jgi:predicted dehydrogenase
MIRIGIIGYGYWGPNLARNFARCEECSLVRIVDLDPRRLEAVQRDWPGVETSTALEDVTRADDIDAVAIVTPIQTHFELALEALLHHKHVLVEKPMADSVAHCERLIEEAARRNLILMVDHTFVYTEAVRWMREFVAAGNLGDLYYFDSARANLGLFQRDASVIWDLAPHDLSILHAVTGRSVQSVSATGACHAGSRVPNIAYLSLDLGEGAIAHFHVNWLSPVKVRQTTLAGSQKMVVYDDMQTSEKIRVYDCGVSIRHQDEDGQYRMRVDYRAGDMCSPALAQREALQTEVRHFVRCVQGQETPLVDGEAGLAVVRILEAAECSLRRDGRRIEL